MSYEHDLAFALRLRGVSEARIAEAVREVQAHTLSAGTSPEAEFGTPEEYASTFPATKRRTRGARVVVAATILALAYVVLALALKPLVDIDIRSIIGPVMLWPALVIIAGGVLAGFLVDYLRPSPRSTR